MTNLEWIRTLSAEELAKLLDDDCYMCSKLKGGCDMNCESGYITWLNAEHVVEPKPCPLCGDKMIAEYNHGHYLVCKSCGLYFGVHTISVGERELAGVYAKKAELIDDWNRRLKGE